MSLKLSLHTKPDVPLEADVICPDKLGGVNESAIAALTVFHGNDQTALGDFFTVKGQCDGEIHIEGDLANVKHLGSEMTTGKMVIEGDVGQHLGACMSGGEIVVEGNAHDWVAPEMMGGRVTIKGSAGHLVGSAYRGSTIGMQGGEIIVHGNVKNETGHAMRGGLIAIGGNTGDFTGVNMLAGTIIVLGEMGIRNGASMKRGTIISMHDAAMIPTFTYACTYNPTYLRLYLSYIRNLGLEISDAQINGNYKRWIGDAIELNKGEILLYAD
jgi:formylmethanofuran dehydrogenase subunit C